jgi:hypothetical protein
MEAIMAKAQFRPVSRVMAGQVLVASILRRGNGRAGSPVRWLVYWSPVAERMGAQPGQTFGYRQEAEAAALQWATHRITQHGLGPSPHVEVRR